MKRAAAALLALLACTGAAPPRTSTCQIGGWGKAQQTLVRAAPSTGARVIAVLPRRAAQEQGEDINGTLPEFDVISASSGWFQIENATFGDYGDPAPRRAIYDGRGWVSGDQIGGQLFSGRLYAAPSEQARSRPYGKSPDEVTVRRLLDCRGRWARIEADIGTGWVQGMCNNQVTTCG